MKVINIHTRTIDQPIQEFPRLINSLATDNDLVWPHSKWPKMFLDSCLQVGSRGGHGPIRYAVSDIKENRYVEFTFNKPKGFEGKHMFTLEALDSSKTKLTHEINVEAKGTSWLQWITFIRPLHDALIEDCFDKIENQFSTEKKSTKWSLWVILLRKLLA